eukprot:1951648-Pyramimonas_sp.AAC.1
MAARENQPWGLLFSPPEVSQNAAMRAGGTGPLACISQGASVLCEQRAGCIPCRAGNRQGAGQG